MATPQVGIPGSTFIHPLMSQVERLGIAADLLATPTRAVAFDAGARVTLRAAAWSMLQEPLDPSWTPPKPGVALEGALADEPTAAAGAVWHAPPAAHREISRELATRAAVHEDAHLVKYTLACLDAAAWDARFAHLYLAAAARLHGVWVELDAATRETAGAPV
jgi:hypothetical protein